MGPCTFPTCISPTSFFFPRKKFFRREDNALFPLDAPPPRLSGMLRSEGKGVKGEFFSLK